MNRLFVILFVSSIIISYVLDRPEIHKAKTAEKWIYGLLMSGSGVLGFLSLAQIRLPMPTTWVANEIVPAIQKYMMH